MKRLAIFAISLLWVLSACAPATQIAPAPVVDNRVTPSPVPTNTITTTPTETPTASITPLPTIPTFTPTFDASTIVTVTPAPPAVCPKKDPSLSPDLANTQNFPIDTQKLLDSLNNGASISTIANAINPPGFDSIITSEEVTGDDVPEMLLVNSEPIYHFYIYTCSQGKYNIHFPNINYFGYYTEIVTAKDLNSNGIPEIILQHSGCSGNGCYSIYILEWNGNEFQVMNSNSQFWEGMNGLINVEIKDLNNDNLFEIFMTGGVPALGAYIIDPPWRLETKISAWNGEVFALESVQYESPKFRFQAVQDGDRASSFGSFDEAMKSYKEAIFNDDLEWWSSQRQIETIIKLGNEGYSTLGTPAPGAPDLAEFSRLAAYSYYRIMLLHFVQANESDANIAYNTLQEKFANEPYGQPYVEMATAFWDAYQSTHKMYDGCAAAIQYAAEHPEILTPLGSDYHGAQSHIYMPADVCPFR